jgi:hypothetical protein
MCFALHFFSWAKCNHNKIFLETLEMGEAGINFECVFFKTLSKFKIGFQKIRLLGGRWVHEKKIEKSRKGEGKERDFNFFFVNLSSSGGVSFIIATIILSIETKLWCSFF